MKPAVFSAAAALIAGTAGLFLWKKKNPSAEVSFVRKSILTPDSYREITSAIREQFNVRYWPELKRSRDERRRCHPDSAEYQTIVLNFQKTIKRLNDESTEMVLKTFRLPKSIFEESVNFFDSDEELKEFGENLIKPIPRLAQQTKLSMGDTKRILEYFSTKLKEKNYECLDVDEYLVLTSQIEDEIYKAYRIEIEELNSAYEKFKDSLEEIVEPMKMQTSSIMASSDNSF
jgi:hypothetical protein